MQWQVSDHAVEQYMSRVRPDLDGVEARKELEALVGSARRGHVAMGGGLEYIAEGVTLVVRENRREGLRVVVTVLRPDCPKGLVERDPDADMREEAAEEEQARRAAADDDYARALEQRRQQALARARLAAQRDSARCLLKRAAEGLDFPSPKALKRAQALLADEVERKAC